MSFLVPLVRAAAPIVPGITSGGAGGGLLATSKFGVGVLKTGAALGKVATAVTPAIGAAAIIGGAGLRAAGQLQAGEAAAQQGIIESGLAETQAVAEEARAAEERTQTAQLETERREQGRRDVARVVSRTAGAGFELAGTPLLQITDFLTDIEEDVKNIQITGERQAQAAESRAASRRLTGLTLEDIGRQQRVQSRFAAGSSLLTGVGNLFV